MKQKKYTQEERIKKLKFTKMKINKYINIYKIGRHISREMKTGFFIVDTDYEKGIGFQISTKAYDYGISIYLPK